MDDKTIGIESLNLDFSELAIRLKKENKELKQEVAHLKELLSASLPVLDKGIHIHVSKEQAACEIQISMINEKSKDRELTLEETKRLEILIKSLYLIKEKSKGIDITENVPTSIEDLTKIATDGI